MAHCVANDVTDVFVSFSYPAKYLVFSVRVLYDVNYQPSCFTFLVCFFNFVNNYPSAKASFPLAVYKYYLPSPLVIHIEVLFMCAHLSLIFVSV